MTDEYPDDPNRREDDKNCFVGFPKCPTCDTRSRPKSGELVCLSCKTVVQDNYLNISRARHTRTNAESNQSKARSATTRTRHDRGLGSSIDSTYGSPQNTTGRDLERAQRWWSTNGQDQSLQFGNNEIKRVTAALGLPKWVREEASRLFHVATVEENRLHGRSIELVVAGSVHIAACLHEVPRTASEVANEAVCDKNEVYRGRQLVAGQKSPPLPEAVDYLPRFAQFLRSKTNLNYQQTNNLRSTAHHLIAKTVNQNRGARVLAASALYAAAQLKNIGITQTDVAEVTGVNEATISRHYGSLLNTAS